MYMYMHVYMKWVIFIFLTSRPSACSLFEAKGVVFQKSLYACPDTCAILSHCD